MPQYLAPGVYVEEIAGPRSIEGVGTSTAAFVGPSRFGPTSGRAELLTSYLDFTRLYGDLIGLDLVKPATPLDRTSTLPLPNYLALGVKGFFDEGGTSLYVARVFKYTEPTKPENDHASVGLKANATPVAGPLTIRARFPGSAGRMMVTLTLRVGNNVLSGAKTAQAALSRVREYDTVYATVAGAPGAPSVGGVYNVQRDQATGKWKLAGTTGGTLTVVTADAIYPITVVVDLRAPSVDSQGLPSFGPLVTLGEFGFDPRSSGGGITAVLAKNPATRAQALTLPIAIEGVPTTTKADEVAATVAYGLLGSTVLATAVPIVQPTPPNPPIPPLKATDRQVSVTLANGSDGFAPTAADYEGEVNGFTDYQGDPIALTQVGLKGLESIDDISIVASPGASAGWKATQDTDVTLAQAINNSVITHCEKMHYRVAALDTPPGLLPTAALEFRDLRSSEYASLYYPWVTIPNPSDGTRLNVPPSGYMAGIWARSDNSYGVIKAPANEPVRSAIDFETRLNKAQQELLNPEGVNCLRYFPGPGFLVWGARTLSEDPEWKYLSMRRYFNYLEKSIDEGTQWVVFEVNGPQLWDAVRHTIEGFLLNEWKNHALLGAKPEQGFYVKCDASTMTQDDLDNGRLICIVGVAAAKPAEFVIFRISQWTAATTS